MFCSKLQWHTGCPSFVILAEKLSEVQNHAVNELHGIDMKTPRETFQEDLDARKFHENLVADKRFSKAVDYALLEMMAEENATVSEITSARFNGAIRFKHILLTLADINTLPRTDRTKENLNHKV